MTLPLANLPRPPGNVLLMDAFAAPRTANPGDARPVALRALHDAAAYLRFWRQDRGAMASLRSALSRHRQRPVSRLSDDEVIAALARHVADGALVLAEERRVPTAPVAFGAAAGAGALEAPEAPARPRALAPGSLSSAPLLPLLEKVQIEGAEVLPEVLQTLEQLELSLEKIDLASVSLDPAPSGVPPIDEAMRQASEAVTGTLDDL
jgi:hypothetical protein